METNCRVWSTVRQKEWETIHSLCCHYSMARRVKNIKCYNTNMDVQIYIADK